MLHSPPDCRSTALIRIVFGLLIVFTLFSTLSDAAANEKSYKNLQVSGNSEYPPLLWQSPTNPEELIGAVPALLKEILEPLGVTADIHYLGSWARVLRHAETGRLDMVAGAFMTRERFQFMDYMLPPVIQLPAAVWVPKGKEFLYRHWPDLRGRVGSTVIGNSFGQRFDQYARDNLHLEYVRSIDQSFAMARVGRIDYVLYEKLQGEAMLERAKKAHEFTALNVPISQEGLFFTFSKNSPCNTFEFREKVADRLYQLVNSGRVDELVSEYTDRYVTGD